MAWHACGTAGRIIREGPMETDRIAVLERQVKVLRVGFVAFAAVSLWSLVGIARASAGEGPQASIVARRIAVVDDKGVERVVIASPVPDPLIDGVRMKRAQRASGMVIVGRDGRERGGYLTDDEETNGAMLTLDGTDGQVLTAYANAKGGATLSLDNGNRDSVTLTSWQRPIFQMKRGGKVFFNQPADAPPLH
jgi:hypothetical protein